MQPLLRHVFIFVSMLRTCSLAKWIIENCKNLADEEIGLQSVKIVFIMFNV